MKKLWEVAMSTGKYDLTRSNCHHAAQAVYNACVPHSDPHLKVSHLGLGTRWDILALEVQEPGSPTNYRS